MKISKILYGFLFFAFAALVVVSCKDDEELYPQLGSDPKSITEILSETSDLSSLFGAIDQVNLDSILSLTTTYTVYAPNNNALSGIDLTSLDPDALTNALLNHIIETNTADFASTLSTGYLRTMATGPDDLNLSFYTDKSTSTKFNGVASLVDGQYDKGATNGVVHIVDGALLPPTVVDHIKANPNYSILAQAIELAGLEDALSAEGPFTVFAPNNAAFESLMVQLNGAFGWSSLADVPVDVLTELLSFHVVGEDNILAESVDGTTQTSLTGETFAITGVEISDASYSNASINITDIQGVNGIVHGIDKVLLTSGVFQSVLGATLNIAERSEDRGFTTFLEAVDKVGMRDAIATTDNLTAFVPSNDGFEALFSVAENFESLTDFDTDEELSLLKDILNYQLYVGELMESDFVDGSSLTSVYGDSFTVDLTGDFPRLRPSFEDAIPTGLVTTNIGATNGIIHESNRVMISADFLSALGIDTGGCDGAHPVGDPNAVFFDWDANGPWWGNMASEGDASISLDGSNYGRANFTTGGGGWNDMFWRNDAGTFNGATAVGTNLDDYVLKFDIRTNTPISAGTFKFRFNSPSADAFYDFAPWIASGEALDTESKWISIEIPLSVLGQPDFSAVNAEFGMAFDDGGTPIALDFAIDNVRFDAPGYTCGGPEPVANTDWVFFDWDVNGPWWGNVASESEAALSLDGSSYGRANFTTGGGGWNDMFWRNDASTFNGASVVGADIDDYVLKFDILTISPIAAGTFRFRFNSPLADAFYDYAPWIDSGEPLDTEGDWITITIPLSDIGQPDFSAVNAEFGMAFDDGGVPIALNFALDNVRFETK